MTAANTDRMTTWRPHRWAGAFLACIAVYALLGFIGVPWLAERIATDKVREILGAELRIGNIDFNPFTFAVVIEDVEFDHPSGDPFASIGAVRANFEPTALPGGTLLFAEGRVTRPAIFIQRDAQGKLNAASVKPLAPARDSAGESDAWPLVIEALQVEAMSLRLTDSTVAPAAQFGIDDLFVAAERFSTAPDSPFPVDVSMRLTSGGTVSAQGEIKLLPRPDVGLSVTMNDVSPEFGHAYLQSRADVMFDSGSFYFAGTLSTNPDELFALEGDAHLDDLVVTETEGGARLGSWNRLAVNGVELSLTRKSLGISEVVIDEPYADILIAANGSINLRRAGKGEEVFEETPDEAGEANGETENVPSEPAERSEPDFNVTIGRTLVRNAAATFEDRALPLPFLAKIDELNGQLSTIATSSSEPSEVEFEGRVDEFGQVLVSGHVTPLVPKRNTSIDVEFVNVEVPKFSAFTIRFAGYEIASGRLDLKLGYEIRDSQLVGENNIVLRDFELGDEVPYPDAANLPLRLAVALLKDPSGRINVDLPVSGDVDKPEFSVAGVVGKALGNLITGIAAAPFKILGNLLGMQADELEALHFTPGRADLSPPQREIAAKLGEALAMRPDLALELEGAYHADADSLALREEAVDERIEAGIGNGDASAYAETRTAVIESLFREATGEALPADEADPVARAARLRDRLIESEALAEDALQALAEARAGNARDTILSTAPELGARVSVVPTERARSLDDGLVRMNVRLVPRNE